MGRCSPCERSGGKYLRRNHIFSAMKAPRGRLSGVVSAAFLRGELTLMRESAEHLFRSGICRRTPAHPEPHCAFLTDDPWRVRAFVQVCDRLTQSRQVMLHLKREGEVRHLLINYIPDTVRQRSDELPKPIARAHLYHLTSARRPVDQCAGA